MTAIALDPAQAEVLAVFRPGENLTTRDVARRLGETRRYNASFRCAERMRALAAKGRLTRHTRNGGVSFLYRLA